MEDFVVTDQEIAAAAPPVSSFGAHCRDMGTHVPRFEGYDKNQTERWVNDQPEIKISKINSGVCEVYMGFGRRCGRRFPSGVGSLRRHIRLEHRINVPKLRRNNTKIEERNAGRTALVQYVLSGEWAAQVFNHEPYEGPEQSMIGPIADCLDDRARTDAEFRTKYGESFHRPSVYRRRLSRAGARAEA